MFRTGSPYSPFFTSGLLSSCPSSADRQFFQEPLTPRRGSLPTDMSPTRSSDADEASTFYFTLQPGRDHSEYRSFLSLDLAESQSLRSASLRRKASNASKAPSRNEKRSFLVFSQILEEQSNLLAVPQQPRRTVRGRLSKDSLRSIPSPKPAPSSQLPDIPPQPSLTSSSSASVPCTPPRLPSIAINPSLGLLDRASKSMSALVISRTPTPADIQKLPNRVSVMTQRSTSSVSSGLRRFNRSQALARLEGRVKPIIPPPLSPKRIGRNFMSMSDDEDDDEDLDVDNAEPRVIRLDVNSDRADFVSLNTTLEPEDVVIPAPSANLVQASRSAPITGRFPSLSLSHSSSHRRKPHHPTAMFPLKSFIDLHNDEDTSGWNWRSFIEVSGVS